MKEIVKQTVKALKRGDTILYPTDTVWGIGCDATNARAIDAVYTLKKREYSKALVCLVSDIVMLKQYVNMVPEVAYELIANTDRPTTIIYDTPFGIAENMISENGSLAIRVTNDVFCRQLISTYGKPIVATSANVSGASTPGSYKEIASEILKGVNHIVNLYHDKISSPPSTIIKLGKHGLLEIIRK